MRLVSHTGLVWRMSDRSYRRMLSAVATGKELPTFKTLKAECLGEIDCNVTDLDAELARYYLCPSEENEPSPGPND